MGLLQDCRRSLAVRDSVRRPHHLFTGYSGSFLSPPPLDGHWIYTPEQDCWREAAPLPTARGALVAAVAGDQIFTIGWTSEEDTTGIVEVYDPAAGAWRLASSMPTAAAVLDGRWVVLGGESLEQVFEEVEVYRPATNSWTTVTPMPTLRWGTGRNSHR